ncbi:uncharacterized protein LOC134676552 [Cydia fagiglandana]|uniref:uncharacterized protein LOC134676552 n=1 Tax=Cydia fagiglandana TaxID=1458189 RepID=UPI002FEE070C
MQDHVEPKPSFMAERYRFRLRRQGEEESVAQYLTELKKLSKHCEFDTSLEDNLRDQFTCGLKNDTIKQRLFAEKNIYYSKAVSLALSLEAAERDAATVERPSASESNVARSDMASVNSITPGPRGGNKGNNPNNRQNNGASISNMSNNGSKCTVCGREGHREADCRYRNFTCSKCGCVGHLRRVCPSSGAASGQGAARGRSSGAGGRGSRRAFHHVQAAQYETPGADDDNSSDTEFEEHLHHLCLSDYSAVSMSMHVDNIMYKELFSGGLGRFTGGKATLRVKEGAAPVYCRARPLPYALRDRVDHELDEMLRSGVIEPVDTSEWATPLVPVRKADGGLRICADYKITLNPNLLIDRCEFARDFWRADPTLCRRRRAAGHGGGAAGRLCLALA